MIKPILFLDLDGVILDVSERIFAVYRDILEDLGKQPLSPQEYRALKRTKTPLRDILVRTGAEDAHGEFERQWLRLIEDPRYLKLDKPFPGALEALAELGNDWRLVAVTLRHHKKHLLGQLADLNLVDTFSDVLVASGRSSREKWRIKADLMSDFGFETGSAVCGDTETDIVAGKELGIKTVAVCSGMRSKEFLETLNPDILLKSISELPVALAWASWERDRLSKVAEWYHPDDAEHGKMENALIRYRINSILPRIIGPAVLEMGCSMGIMTKRLAEKFSDLTVVEGSGAYVEYVKNTVGGHVSFVVSLFEEYNPGREFDDIVMANILEHVENPQSIMSRAAGWLKPEGRIHILVPNADSLHRKMGAAMGLLGSPGDFTENDKKIGHRRVYTLETLERDIANAGLCVRHREGIFLKPLSHAQMNAFDESLYDALYEVGKELPHICSTIYMVCERNGKSGGIKV